MARDKTIKFLRTTRSNLDTQKNASNLIIGEPYLITDESRLAIGTANNGYAEFPTKNEVKEILTAYRTSNFTLSSTSLIDITGMSVTLKANKSYHISCEVGMLGGSTNACELDLILTTASGVYSMSASWSSEQIINQVDDSFSTSVGSASTIAGLMYNSYSSLSLGLIKGVVVIGGSDTTLKLQGKKTAGVSVTLRNCVLIAREL